MPYTHAQIGTADIRPFSTRTKDRVSLVLVQHGRAPGCDETILSIIAPCSWPAGRTKTLAMLAAGIDCNDIRFVRIPDGYSGPGDKAGEGLPMEPVRRLLWWTVEDDRRAADAGLTMQQYAARLSAQRGAS